MQLRPVVHRSMTSILVVAAVASLSSCDSKTQDNNSKTKNDSAAATSSSKADSTRKALSARTPIPERVTPSLADAGVSQTDITKLTADDREAYLGRLSFAGGASGDEATCPSSSCDASDP